ncbi:16S rRNA (cytosine(967)-C(5))-methyltransferase RsmB [Motiliproteus sp. MSK22-1]|uniref:16S rRNA (cytosine(967)-C(5))-methyltransferase RsmB n=1 Tax=Motiliproteus sp. MSK22-1 TaxID=1897630 RepID=UPI0009775F82|nr:16S rRNA (cytosine(967)-C(5))-methyltransferase RsmB [Motiliproteus sp. MSK22-1]OMH39462.1 16S rRNA (cytosine(967)-C(5))-methyltransferase [Motiliproteus sp. MSK22-1]
MSLQILSVRVQASRVLASILKREASLSTLLPVAITNTPANERPLLQQLCYGTLRYLPQLELIAQRLLAKPLKPKDQDVQALILMGLYQLLHSRVPAHAAISETVQAAVKLKKKPWAKGLVNAVLRNFQRQPELQQTLQQNPIYSYAHPQWLIKRIKNAWPDHWSQVLEQNNNQAPMTLRVNLSAISRPDYSERLKAEGIPHHFGQFAATAIILDNPVDVDQLPGFSQGLISVQDEAAQLAAGLLDLQPQQRVLDACAAPGGKTGHILESETNLDHCLALDVSPDRLIRIEENLQRIGLNCELKTADAAESSWWDGQPFDRILLDAPCSATGVIRRNPDIKSLRKNSDIGNLSALQLNILENLWSMLGSDGRLVYATCSVLPDENEAVIKQFLDTHPEAVEFRVKADWGIERSAGRQLFPQENSHDGFYYAVIDKKG